MSSEVDQIDDGVSSTQSTRRPVIRWRVVPAILYSLFGGMNCILAPLPIVTYFIEFRHVREIDGGQFLWGLTLFFSSGVLFLAAGRSWWRKKWWFAVVASILGHVCGAVGAQWIATANRL